VFSHAQQTNKALMEREPRARMRFSSPALPQRLAESVFLHSFVAIWQYLLASYSILPVKV